VSGRGATLVGRWLDAGGTRLHVRASAPGSGPTAGRLPLVMIHGLGVSGRTLLPLARRLASERAVLVPDLPGFGRSPAPRPPRPRALDVSGLAAAVAAAMSAAGCARAAILGHSLGGQVAVELADRFPQRVARLVLVAPTVDRAARTAGREILHLLADSYREPPSLIALAAWDYLAAGPRRIWATLRFALADAIEIKLPWIEAPALVVRGGRDPLVSQRWAEEVARRLPAGELATLARAAHAAPYSAPRELAALVGRFLGD
jgi:pimeloyl-ACP methyl ester carboxylesterase